MLQLNWAFVTRPSDIASDSIVPGEYQGRQNLNGVHNNTILSFVGEIDIKLSDQIAYRKRPVTNHQTQRQWRPGNDTETTKQIGRHSTSAFFLPDCRFPLNEISLWVIAFKNYPMTI